MKTNQIGLIGHGKLGQAFAARIKEKTNRNLLISNNREESAAVAAASSELILMTKPKDLGAALHSIRNELKDTLVISFAAAVPRHWMESIVGEQATIVRAMADIDFKQIICEESEQAAQSLSALSEAPLIQTNLESDIDTMTILVGCLPGITAWQAYHRPKEARAWLQRWQELTEERIKIPMEVTESVIQENLEKTDLMQVILEVSTPGGVTASMIEAMIQGEMDHEKLFQIARERIDLIAHNAMS